MDNIQKIAEKINTLGGRLYLVGGAVRDELLGKENHDNDYCITGITAEEFQKAFPQAKIRGKSFPVFIINNAEFALARSEEKVGEGHRGFKIITNKQITIEEDLARRDITINSIAIDILTNKRIDPFNGAKDIEQKIIRATTTHFKEDPLRVYRVARIAAQLGFTVEEKTLKLMNELKEELKTLSAERVFAEFSKALETDKPSIFFNVSKQANILEVHFKEIANLIGAEQPIKYHPEGDAYNHTMQALDNSAKLTKQIEKSRQLEIRFATLVHDLGKGVTPKTMYPHHYGHEEAGVPLVRNLGKNLKIPNRWIKCGKTACREHMRGGIFAKMTPAKQVDFIERVNKSILGLDGLKIVVISDRTRDCKDSNLENINFDKIGNKCLTSINGEYIEKKYNLKPGKKLGERLHQERINWLKLKMETGKIEN